MNIYIRFFDNEILVKTADEALDFLRGIREITVDEFLEREIKNYVDGKMQFPKRFKVSNRAYFIMIKTTAETMEAFKSAGLTAREPVADKADADAMKKQLTSIKPGWYDATLQFRRVVTVPQMQKCQYVDTTFRAKVKANSILECYNKIVEHLKSRDDIDKRSQFPSAKGRNFKCVFVEQA